MKAWICGMLGLTVLITMVSGKDFETKDLQPNSDFVYKNVLRGTITKATNAESKGSEIMFVNLQEEKVTVIVDGADSPYVKRLETERRIWLEHVQNKETVYMIEKDTGRFLLTYMGMNVGFSYCGMQMGICK